jgi:hypothetical protein
MRRIGLAVILTVSFALAPIAAEAQGLPIVAALWTAPASIAAAYGKALEAGLSELGWIEGRRVVFEHRFPDSPERVPALATELVALRPSVIMVAVNPVIQNAQQLPKLATNSNSFEFQSTSRPDTRAGGSAGLEPPRRTW